VDLAGIEKPDCSLPGEAICTGRQNFDSPPPRIRHVNNPSGLLIHWFYWSKSTFHPPARAKFLRGGTHPAQMSARRFSQNPRCFAVEQPVFKTNQQQHSRTWQNTN
jgi:hypothetical protein